MDGVDLAALLFRTTLGGVMLAHGWNHLFGPGGVDGTARWFGSMGLRPPRVHALASGSIELASGAALLLGLLTTLSCAAVIGVMTVAFVTAHRRNGFFIFKPGQGWEYVAVLAVVTAALGALGPGEVSVDQLLGFADELDGALGLLVSAGLGLAGAAVLLAVAWRPDPPA